MSNPVVDTEFSFTWENIPLHSTALPLKNPFVDLISAFIKMIFWNDGTMLTNLFRTTF